MSTENSVILEQLEPHASALSVGRVLEALQPELQRLSGGENGASVMRALRAVGESSGEYYLATILKTVILAGSAVSGVRTWEFDSSVEATRFKCYAELYIGALREMSQMPFGRGQAVS